MNRRQTMILPLIMLTFLNQSCTLIFPSHSRSNARDQERVVLLLLTLDQMKPHNDLFKAAFGEDLPLSGARAAGPIAALGSLAAGFAIDFVKAQLEKEAELHEAQYSAEIAEDKFWKRIPQSITTEKTTTKTTTKSESQQANVADPDFTFQAPRVHSVEKEITEIVQRIEPKKSYEQRYYGFKIIRYALVGNCQSKKIDDGLCQASEILFGVNPSADEQMFRVAPLSFSTSYAKAKVISDELTSYVWPPFFSLFGKGLRFHGHTIDVDVSVEINAYWRGKDQQLNITKVAAFQTKLAGYDIAQCDTKAAEMACRPVTLTPDKGLNKASGGWLLGVPISFDPEGKPAVGSKDNESGTFTLKVTVTERDSSNAKQLLERAAELVGQQKDKIQQQISR